MRRTLNMMAIISSPCQGRSPQNISKTTQPNDQMSTFALYPRPWLCTTSGAIPLRCERTSRVRLCPSGLDSRWRGSRRDRQ